MVQRQVAGSPGQTVGGPERILAAVRRPWAREVAVLAAYLAAGVAATWPLASWGTLKSTRTSTRRPRTGAEPTSRFAAIGRGEVLSAKRVVAACGLPAPGDGFRP